MERGDRDRRPLDAAEAALVLDLDPDLGRGVNVEEWDAARRACRGTLLRLSDGVWDVPLLAGERDDLLGLLIVDGLLCREVSLHDRHMLELLGPGAVLQLPVVSERPRLGGDIRLTAVTGAMLVGLGESFIHAAGRWPTLLPAIHRRLEAQREHLAIQGLIAHLPRAEHRLLLQLWHLADRYGRVTPEGTQLPLPLRHDLLGQLAACRRSTVTLAIGALASEGCIRRMADGSWLITAIAERRVDAIARGNGTARVLGESLMRPRSSARRRVSSQGQDGHEAAVRYRRRPIRWSSDEGAVSTGLPPPKPPG
jgi:CRP/FNR family transcriptional regulator, cyclic AMP receptor protein